MSWDCRGAGHFTCVIAGRLPLSSGFDSCRGHIFRGESTSGFEGVTCGDPISSQTRVKAS